MRPGCCWLVSDIVICVCSWFGCRGLLVSTKDVDVREKARSCGGQLY
jgi:hypothetical protein